MSVPLKSVELEQAGLAERMAASKVGQVTWASLPDVGKRCASCVSYCGPFPTRGKNKGFGRCSLVKAHTRKDGVYFPGRVAIACPHHTERQS